MPFLKKLFLPLSKQDLDLAEDLRHFFFVDLARGVCALIVLIWHYQHFYWTPSESLVAGNARQPFFDFLKPFYTNGYWSVQMFWAISGFVFAHVYAQRPTSPGTYFINRVSRLYPLHYLTLFCVAILQICSKLLTGNYQITSFNDGYHFLLNLFFMSSWTFEKGYSFNAPAWSVSVEEAMFITFFLIHRIVFRAGILLPLLLLFLGGYVMHIGTRFWLFGICGFYFYLGLLIYFYVMKFGHRTRTNSLICITSIAIFFQQLGLYRAGKIEFTTIEFFIILPSLLALAMADLRFSCRQSSTNLEFCRTVGNLTYSSYLIHFPIQVIVLVVLQYFNLGNSAFDKPIVLCFWIVFIFGLSRICFLKFEMPMKLYLKELWNARLRSIRTSPLRSSVCSQADFESVIET